MKNAYKAIVFLFLLFTACTEKPIDIHLHYLMAGEPGSQSVILQARLAESDTLIYEDIHNPELLMQTQHPGKVGVARFEYAESDDFKQIKTSPWMQNSPDKDYILKYVITDLNPGKQYFYRLRYGLDEKRTKLSGVQSVNTLPGAGDDRPVSFVMVTGSHLTRFYTGGGFGKASSQGIDAYREEDKYEGFHGFESILKRNPLFFIGNGDNVYYDQPEEHKATTLEEMRAMWQRQFYMPRFRKMFASVPVFWMKDDHDHRFDDSDTVAVNERHGAYPSNESGIATFLEQVPVVDPNDPDPKTYRKVRVNKDLEIWMVEGRDYRSPNTWPDGPDKSIWGEEQKAWLKATLLKSDATFKILVTPTPMVGPDGAGKKDNHANPDGFMYEGNEFFDWLSENNFQTDRFFIITGDRHWQYHSIHPSGFQEYSCGAMVDQNSRLGVDPGDPNSNDPEGRILQPYTSKEPSGGFLEVKVNKAQDKPAIAFNFFDEFGKPLYSHSGEVVR
ncbi:MAG: alkaline phosphatase D family protein [Cyclobacteriaceae bacterium]|nr:alkaline phosphatase D family protein [Cyclobacteriaceae bacterium]